MFFYFVYVSSAFVPFTKEELLALLAKSREKNARLGITGMLLYKDGNFMQVLEGEESAVRALGDTIHDDPRHHGMIPILEGHAEERQFPDWSMGFRDLGSEEAKRTPGYSEFLSTPLTVAEFAPDPTRCRKLLLMFRRNM
jgi:Sensors of blue-light using FAD